MPLLDPEQQFYFCSSRENKSKASKLSFFLNYLPIASNHLRNNYSTISTYPFFKSYFLENISFINKEFGLSIPSKEKLQNLCILDFFSYFYQQLPKSHGKLEGEYFVISKNTILRCFEPFIDETNTHHWYFTDSSFVVLAINDDKLNTSNMKIAEVMINLETLLLKSVGLSIVLCTQICSTHTKCHFIIDLIKKGYFIEIHMNFNRQMYKPIQDFNIFLQKIIKIFSVKLHNFQGSLIPDNDFFGYLYLYLPYSSKISTTIEALRAVKKNPFYDLFVYSFDLSFCFNQVSVQKVRGFAFCDTGFKSEVVKVNICKVPLYDKQNEYECLSPSKISQIETGYVSKNDFIMWNQSRVEIIFDNETKYVQFSDLHIMKPELYVTNTLLFMEKEKEGYETTEFIMNEFIQLYHTNHRQFVQQKIKKFIDANKNTILRGLIYLSYAVKCFRGFDLRPNQIYAAFEASRSCLFRERTTDKGVIYQLETGEGKSIIIQVIAALLALNGRFVHIATSNILLSKRDYADSYNFFKNLGLESAVFLHDNEIANNSLSDEESKKEKEFFDRPFYSERDFKNSLRMNFIVCGLKNNGKRIKNDIRIIYSTFINFEALYLKLIENWVPRDVSNYFAERSLIIDEADAILIDDLANGTILSRSMPSNASKVLPFIYQCKMGQLTYKNFFKIVAHLAPNLLKQSIKPLFEMYSGLIFDQNAEKEQNSKDASNEEEDDELKKELNQEQKENAENLLNFVFLSKMGQLNPPSLKEMVRILWPNRNETCIHQVEEIYREIKVAHKEEMKNRTIPSNLMEPEVKQMMTFICQTKIGNPNKTILLQMIKRFWPECTDMDENNLDSMFGEIELVQKPEFNNGKKYTIEKVTNPNKKKKKKKSNKFINGVSKLFNMSNELRDLITRHVFKIDDEKKLSPDQVEEINQKQIEEIIKEEEERANKDEEKINKVKTLEEEEEEEEAKEEEDFIEWKEIVPFDYENKGIIERNKEFGGFVQQFIAIKEKLNDPKKKKNIKIKDMSLNYLYVSHPIFVKLYGSVCGFTGTIGNQKDKNILKKQYLLETDKIPRNKPNQLIHLPTILCSKIQEKNQMILQDVFEFNVLNIPVLVILRDLCEIKKLKNLLEAKGIFNVNVFDGINENINPEKIAGLDGAVSLGTNFCGRGTNIENNGKPLHIIITYYTSNERVMQQIYGRTARKGKEGTCRIICLEKEFIQPTSFVSNNQMKKYINDFEIKKVAQMEFVEYYRNKYEWLFELNYNNIKIDSSCAEQMKKSSINVNRIKAFNYKFPICMNIDTFLRIQAQKIYSLYNCPNSRYTWYLFQKYIREMILESWSLFIDDLDRKFELIKDIEIRSNYGEYIRSNIGTLYEKLNEYLPTTKNTDILSTFMNIHEKVTNYWEPLSRKIFQSSFMFNRKSSFTNCFVSLNYGLMPFTLLENSGLRISSLEPRVRVNYITDPEIRYFRLKEDGVTKILASLTEKIDGIFDMICNKLNEVIGGFTGFRFFMRRTIVGCEFGACLDLNFIKKDVTFLGQNCLIDTDPLILFTIHVKSFTPFLAGILIIVLVFATKICYYIALNINAIIQKFVKKGLKVTLMTALKFLAKKGLQYEIDELFRAVIGSLTKKLESQINNLKEFDIESANFFTDLAATLCRNNISSVTAGVKKKFGNSFKMKKFAKDIFGGIIPHLFKMALTLLLCLIAFIMNFKYKRSITRGSKYNVADIAKKFNENQDVSQSFQKSEPVIEKINPI